MSQFHSRPGRDTLHIEPSSYGRSATHSRPLSTAGPHSYALSSSFYYSVGWPSSECEDPPPHTLVIGCGAFTHLHSTGRHKINCSCFQINSSDKCISDSSTLVQASGARTINKRYKPNRVSRFSALGHPYPRAGQNK